MRDWIIVGVVFFLCAIGLCIDLYLLSRGKKKPSKDDPIMAGKIIVNTTDPSKDTVRFELDFPVEILLRLPNNKKVVFEIQNEDSQEIHSV